jgi:glyoxalase family protein
MRIHHITAIASDPQANVDFYSGVLGLRLVKRTVNFDDPATWHLYYGDGLGSPGTIMTFFAWANLPPLVRAQAKRGAGQIDGVAFRIRETSFDWWQDYLASRAVDFALERRAAEEVIVLRDADGMRVELVPVGEAGAAHAWHGGPVAAEHAIAAMRGVSIPVNDPAPTAALLQETLGFRQTASDGARHRFEDDGAVVDLLVEPDAAAGRMGIGATHHIAWRTADVWAERQWQQRLEATGISTDRLYFQSIYFREPSGVVFEIATDGPGFTLDETESELGGALMLPPWLEPRRAVIAARLPDFTTRD